MSSNSNSDSNSSVKSNTTIRNRPIDAIIKHRTDVWNRRNLVSYESKLNADQEKEPNKRQLRRSTVEQRLKIPENKMAKKARPNANKNTELKDSKNGQEQQTLERILKQIKELHPIYFTDINQSKADIYPNCFLKCIVIDEFCRSSVTIQIFVQDDKGNTGLINIAGFKDEDDTSIDNNFGYGCSIVINCPYFNGDVVYVEKPSDLLFLPGRDIKLCRCCGISESCEKCPDCSNVYYCSDACRKYDWDYLKHGLICSRKKGKK